MSFFCIWMWLKNKNKITTGDLSPACKILIERPASVVPVLKNVGEMSTTKNFHPVSLLSVVSKVFVHNGIIDCLEKWGLFSDFQHSFRSTRSTEDLLTVASDKIVRTFGRSGATQTVALNISKAFNRVWHAGLLHKFKSYDDDDELFLWYGWPVKDV